MTNTVFCEQCDRPFDSAADPGCLVKFGVSQTYTMTICKECRERDERDYQNPLP
jgi:hypothetical protein